MIHAELSLVRIEMEIELATAKETFKTQLQKELIVSIQNRMRAELDVVRDL